MNGQTTILYQDGELQTAASIDGPWTDAGDLSGSHIENVVTNQARFYRVRSH